MKFIMCLCLSFVSVCSIRAQEIESVVSDTVLDIKKHEIGVVGHLDFNEYNSRFILGVQYKHWLTKEVGLRIIGGYSSFNKYYESKSDVYVHPSIKKDDYAHADMLVVGFGMLNQKKVRGKFHRFIGLDILAGFGEGEYQKQIYTGPSISVSPNGGAIFHHTRFSNYSRGFVRLLPSIGGVFVFDRLSFGSEFTFMEIGFYKEKIAFDWNDTFFDLQFFTSRTFRLFLNYRF